MIQVLFLTLIQINSFDFLKILDLFCSFNINFFLFIFKNFHIIFAILTIFFSIINFIIFIIILIYFFIILGNLNMISSFFYFIIQVLILIIMLFFILIIFFFTLSSINFITIWPFIFVNLKLFLLLHLLNYYSINLSI